MTQRLFALPGMVALAVLAMPAGLAASVAIQAAARGPAQPLEALADPLGPAAPSGLAVPGAMPAMPLPAAQEDPADSLYKAAREALNRGEYSQAAGLFKQIREKYPESKYVPDSYYFEAFALYRVGGNRNRREAVALLNEQQARYPGAATSGDAVSLATRIRAELAERGDREAAEALAEVEINADQESCDEEEVALRIAALQSLMQMESTRAAPILQKVLARRDECSRDLRMNAVFIVADQGGPNAEGILLDVARQDPDVEVRRQAVFWLSEVATDQAVAALDSILNDPSSDPEIQQQAIFAIAESDSERSVAILKRYIQDANRPVELRAQAIYWLGESAGEQQVDFIRQLYAQVDDSDLRNQIFFTIAEVGGEENVQWLVARALDPNESNDIRQQAIFFAGEAGVATGQLIQLYDQMADEDFKQHLIFVLAERDDDQAIEKIVDIARSDANPELRRQAVFWLAETGDPRAETILMEILEQ